MFEQRNWFFSVILLFLFAFVFLPGCEKTETKTTEPGQETIVRPPTMTLLVVGDEKLGDVAARQWSARQDGELTVVNKTVEEFTAGDFALNKEFDIVIYPTGLLVELESRESILELPRWLWDSDILNRKELLRHHRLSLIRHGDASWAVPLGSPQLALTYNVDTLKRLNLTPPETWEQLISISEKLKDAGDLKDDDGRKLPTGIALPLSEGWAAQMFLARAAPMIRNRGKLSTVFDRRTLEPLITATPFQKALEDLKTALPNPADLDLTPSMIFEKVSTGEVAIGIAWPGRHPDETDNSSSSANIGFVSVPGSRQWFDIQNDKWNQRPNEDAPNVDLIGFSGLVASVTKSSRNAKWAFKFLEWLSSKSISLITVVDAPLSGPFRASHLGDPARWTSDRISEEAARQYATVIRKCHDQSVVLMFPRLPGREQYLRVLDRFVREYLEGKLDAEEALESVAEQWETITEEKGRQLQISHLRRDAGL